jgi:hypothetical protein
VVALKKSTHGDAAHILFAKVCRECGSRYWETKEWAERAEHDDVHPDAKALCFECFYLRWVGQPFTRIYLNPIVLGREYQYAVVFDGKIYVAHDDHVLFVFDEARFLKVLAT